MLNIHEIAQKLHSELQAELSQKVDETKMLQGALQGISLLHTRLTEAKEEKADEQNPAPKDSKAAAKAKK